MLQSQQSSLDVTDHPAPEFTWHTAYVGARVVYQAFHKDHTGIVRRLGRALVFIQPDDDREHGILVKRYYEQVRFAPKRPGDAENRWSGFSAKTVSANSGSPRRARRHAI